MKRIEVLVWVRSGTVKTSSGRTWPTGDRKLFFKSQNMFSSSFNSDRIGTSSADQSLWPLTLYAKPKPGPAAGASAHTSPNIPRNPSSAIDPCHSVSYSLSQSKTTTSYHTHVCAWKSNPRSSWRRVGFMKVDGVIDKSRVQFDDVLQHDNMPQNDPECANLLKLSSKVKKKTAHNRKKHVL